MKTHRVDCINLRNAVEAVQSNRNAAVTLKLDGKMKTIQRIIEIPLDEVRSNKYESTIERIGDHADTCFICGKRIKDIEKAKYVHYTTDNTIVSYESDDIENSQGFFPVGNDCAKKLIVQFAFKY